MRVPLQGTYDRTLDAIHREAVSHGGNCFKLFGYQFLIIPLEAIVLVEKAAFLPFQFLGGLAATCCPCLSRCCCTCFVNNFTDPLWELVNLVKRIAGLIMTATLGWLWPDWNVDMHKRFFNVENKDQTNAVPASAVPMQQNLPQAPQPVKMS